MPPVAAVIGPHRPSKDSSSGHYHHYYCRGGRRRRPGLKGPLRGQEGGLETRSNACGGSSLRVVIEPEREVKMHLKWKKMYCRTSMAAEVFLGYTWYCFLYYLRGYIVIRT